MIFYQEAKEWKHDSIPIETSKNISAKVIDLLIYKNHYVLNNYPHSFLGKHDGKYICGQCLDSS